MFGASMAARRRGARASYAVVADESERFFRHFAFALVGEQSRSLFEREPAGLRDLDSLLRGNLPQPAPAVAKEIEAHNLETPLAGPCGDVADVSELRHEPSLDPRLLG